jgi:ATP-binding cassette subfamily B protein
VLGSIDFSVVTRIGIILVIMYGGAAVLSFVENFIKATVTARISKSLRASISEKINRMPLKYFDKTSHGDVISRVTNDVDTIGMTLNQSLDGLVRAVTMFFGSIIMMFYTNGTMAVTAIGASLFGFVFMTFIMKKSQKYFKSARDYSDSNVSYNYVSLILYITLCNSTIYTVILASNK